MRHSRSTLPRYGTRDFIFRRELPQSIRALRLHRQSSGQRRVGRRTIGHLGGGDGGNRDNQDGRATHDLHVGLIGSFSRRL